VVLKPGKAHVGARLTVEFTDGTYWPADAAPDWQPPRVALDSELGTPVSTRPARRPTRAQRSRR